MAPGTCVHVSTGVRCRNAARPCFFGGRAAANTQARPPFLASERATMPRFSGKTIIFTPADAIRQVISAQG